MLHVKKSATNHSLQVTLTESVKQVICKVSVDPGATELDEASQSGVRATQPPVHPGDLEESRPHKIINNRQIEASRFTEI